MDRLIIKGKADLKGSIQIKGSKNSALPIMVSALLTKSPLKLKNLPKLEPTKIISEHTPFLPSNKSGAKRGQKVNKGVVFTAHEASRTFSGIAKAMADQWG